MYLSHFGLAAAPFSIAPDPHFLYMSQRHQEALAHLLYGLGGNGGFVLLTGEVGTGKTTICRGVLEQIPGHCDVAYIFNPRLTVEELLATICAEFEMGLPAGNPTAKAYIDCINNYLLTAHARGRNSVLIVDEAQNLSPEVLEQLRLLTNLETSDRKLLQIVLIGQPELAAMLARPELRQLSQRIIARYHLYPLSREEVALYVKHRQQVAGTRQDLFPAKLMGLLYRLTGGIPRLINLVCDRALLGAYAQGQGAVTRPILAQAAREVFSGAQRPYRRWLRWPGVVQSISGRLISAGLAWLGGVAERLRAVAPLAAPASAASSPPARADHPPASERSPAKKPRRRRQAASGRR